MRSRFPLFGLLAALAFSNLAFSNSAMAKEHTVYLGTQGPDGKGIWKSVFNDETGRLSAPELVAEARNASFLAISGDGLFLYSVLESGGGAVGAWKIENDGKLTKLNEQPSGGGGPTHVWIDATGKSVLVANYGGGSVAAFPVQEDGSLGERSAFMQHEGSGPNPRRQEKPHAHGVYTDLTNTRVYAVDLGTDEVKIYRFDAARGTLEPNDPPSARVAPGAGPRHLAFHPNGRFAYVNNELNMTVTAFALDPQSGALTEVQTLSTLPAGADPTGVSTAEIWVHPSGRTLYVSNRGHDTIAVYDVAADGTLKLSQHAPVPAVPRSFALSPDGQWLLAAGQKANQVAVFKLNPENGQLSQTEHSIEVGSPVCVEFVPEKS